jgi:hypothetical protein
MLKQMICDSKIKDELYITSDFEGEIIDKSLAYHMQSDDEVAQVVADQIKRIQIAVNG